MVANWTTVPPIFGYSNGRGGAWELSGHGNFDRLMMAHVAWRISPIDWGPHEFQALRALFDGPELDFPFGYAQPHGNLCDTRKAPARRADDGSRAFNRTGGRSASEASVPERCNGVLLVAVRHQ